MVFINNQLWNFVENRLRIGNGDGNGYGYESPVSLTKPETHVSNFEFSPRHLG